MNNYSTGVLKVLEALKARRIRQPNGYLFGIRWASNLIRTFERGTVAVTYEGTDNFGNPLTFTVTNDGKLIID